MLFADEITLASVSTAMDGEGYPVKDVKMEKIFADTESVKRAEFYEAMRSGVRLEISVKVRTADYGRQNYLKADGEWYRIVRAYRKGDWTELNCEEVRTREEWMV